MTRTVARRVLAASGVSALWMSALTVACERHDSAPKGTPAIAPPAIAPPAIAPPAASAESSAQPSARCITPESVGALAFTRLSGETGHEKAAIAAAGRELTRVLEVPADYFATVQTAGDLVLLELWHRSAFLPETCVSVAQKAGQAGNACAKCRTQAYDPKLGRIVSTKVWERADSEARPGDERAR